eukprot:Rhum_TRINITY_DN15038_c20_g1::Rhum_TRINITY_DN15038_c20_g1_i1::g.135495::m.135495
MQTQQRLRQENGVSLLMQVHARRCLGNNGGNVGVVVQQRQLLVGQHGVGDVVDGHDNVSNHTQHKRRGKDNTQGGKGQAALVEEGDGGDAGLEALEGGEGADRLVHLLGRAQLGVHAGEGGDDDGVVPGVGSTEEARDDRQGDHRVVVLECEEGGDAAGAAQGRQGDHLPSADRRAHPAHQEAEGRVAEAEPRHDVADVLIALVALGRDLRGEDAEEEVLRVARVDEEQDHEQHLPLRRDQVEHAHHLLLQRHVDTFRLALQVGQHEEKGSSQHARRDVQHGEPLPALAARAVAVAAAFVARVHIVQRALGHRLRRVDGVVVVAVADVVQHQRAGEVAEDLAALHDAVEGSRKEGGVLGRRLPADARREVAPHGRPLDAAAETRQGTHREQRVLGVDDLGGDEQRHGEDPPDEHVSVGGHGAGRHGHDKAADGVGQVDGSQAPVTQLDAAQRDGAAALQVLRAVEGQVHEAERDAEHDDGRVGPEASTLFHSHCYGSFLRGYFSCHNEVQIL